MRFSHLTAILGLALVTTGVAHAQDPMLRDLGVEQMNAAQAGTPAPGSLRVSTWVDRHDLTYALRDTVRIFVRTNEDAYVTIVNVGPAGKVTQLFPNAFQRSNRVAAGRAVEVPSASGGSRINVTGPVGAELIKVFVSTDPIKVIPEAQLVGSGAFRGMAGGVSELVRNLSAAAVAGAKGKVAISNLVIKTVSSRRASTGGNSSFVVGQAPQPAQPSPAATESAPRAPAPQSPAASTPPPSAPTLALLEQPFPLLMAADKTAYRAGQKITLAVTSLKPCRLTVLDIATDGTIRVLFPTRDAQSIHVEAMQTVIVSGEASPLTAPAAGPAALRQVVAVCTTDAASSEEGNRDDVPTVTAGTSKDLEITDPADVVKPGGATAVAALSFPIHP